MIIVDELQGGSGFCSAPLIVSFSATFPLILKRTIASAVSITENISRLLAVGLAPPLAKLGLLVHRDVGKDPSGPPVQTRKFRSPQRPCAILHRFVARIADLPRIAALMQRSRLGPEVSLGPAGSSLSVRLYCVRVRNGEPVVSLPSHLISLSKARTVDCTGRHAS
jgi:hypothetical protein